MYLHAQPWAGRAPSAEPRADATWCAQGAHGMACAEEPRALVEAGEHALLREPRAAVPYGDRHAGDLRARRACSARTQLDRAAHRVLCGVLGDVGEDLHEHLAIGVHREGSSFGEPLAERDARLHLRPHQRHTRQTMSFIMRNLLIVNSS
eukprot:274987-Prymnesium_polylepis.2